MIIEQEVTMPRSADSDDEFGNATERFRPELLAHCYRMLGSVHDAQDLVQETYLRAWRGWAGFEGRSSTRAWLYQIATNVCLTALRHGSRRVLPSGLGAPSDDPDGPVRPAGAEVAWLEPFPTPSPRAQIADPAEIAAARDDLRLAVIASLQHLPARQRAVLVLREVLRFSAIEVGEILGMSVPAVKSALQRARARLAEVRPRPDTTVEPDEPAARAVLDRYVDAFQRADAVALESLLRTDASLELIGMRTWFAGKRTCAPYLARHVLNEPGEYRMFATSANGQPAAIAYRRSSPTAPYEPLGVAVLGTDRTHLTSITVFADAGLLPLFGFPPAPPE
jgi:RNA polymerase sigma-70 factor (ECF subfamily)